MTKTLTYSPGVGLDLYSPSYATSHDAKSVLDRILDWLDGASKAQSSQTVALDELVDTFLDCREEDWDGYGAYPVEDDSFLRAKSLLAKLLLRFPAPTASATPHGSLSLEWMVNPRRRVMFSVGNDHQIAYAAIFGDETTQGVASFYRDIPQELSDLLSKLYYLHR